MPGQNRIVLERAAEVALSAGLPLVCAFVDVTVYPVDGTTGGPAAPIDPDGVDENAQEIPRDLAAAITSRLAGTNVDWSMVSLAGEPARALAREAGKINASMIVVGTRGRRLGSAIKELTAGSVAKQLFHRQDRPVLVVPVEPRIPDDDDED